MWLVCVCRSSTLFPLIVAALLLFTTPVIGWRPGPNQQQNTMNTTSDLEFGGLRSMMDPLSSFTSGTIWKSQKRIIRGFLNSISAVNGKHPSVAGWWETVQIYTDQTGANISHNVRLGEEKNDRLYSHGKSLTRLSVQSIIKSATMKNEQEETEGQPPSHHFTPHSILNVLCRELMMDCRYIVAATLLGQVNGGEARVKYFF
ncbi:hypothetical protein NE237_012346 [Protea cynaroides]|uniref:Uncharacterized protein n=1 Tax=Protea cynaroides TaxID=273540 RepID=A0A9Q0JZ55_9MAGN|nr:hypothetical protein NE237_012346 [Protea cynaroides]